jgi:CO dehydrogenase/acetyl-CoA synthase alpha subunit
MQNIFVLNLFSIAVHINEKVSAETNNHHAVISALALQIISYMQTNIRLLFRYEPVFMPPPQAVVFTFLPCYCRH